MDGNDIGAKIPTAGDGDVSNSEAGPGMECGRLGLEPGLGLGLEPRGGLEGRNPGPKRPGAPPGPKMLNGSSAVPELAPATC